MQPAVQQTVGEIDRYHAGIARLRYSEAMIVLPCYGRYCAVLITAMRAVPALRLPPHVAAVVAAAS